MPAINEIAIETASSNLTALDTPAVPSRTARAVLFSLIFWVLAGTVLFFSLYALMSRQVDSPLWTLISAFLAGGVGVYTATLCFRKLPGYRVAQIAILGSYALRVLLGIIIYLCVTDSGYFGGNGVYPYSTEYREFHWTYTQCMYAASILTGDTGFRTKYFIPMKEDKNANIHMYMGAFMAAGGSRHALDLTPLNSFHHVVAGILIAGLALACGYSPRVSLLSGAVAAWIPWAFAASLMWRDSIGLAWVVMAVVLLCLGKEFGLFGSLFSVIPAGFLAWSDRTPYLLAVVIIALLSILFDQQKKVASGYLKLVRLVIVLMLLAPLVLTLKHSIFSASLGKYVHSQASGSFLSLRLLVFPLLILRALAGPFPWFFTEVFDLYTLFDYAFHVFQLAILIIFVLNWRAVIAHTNILTYSALVFGGLAVMAGGVHTAYLAVAAPFCIPLAINTEYKLWKFLVFAALIFTVFNFLYYLTDLQGSHWILDITGY